MRYLKALYHFLGGIYFALILIATVALFVIAGTLIESQTQSHRYAALLTYDNPFFALLLWGFFINILFSATRRWPFQTKHVPFLITHLGLLMVIGGSLAKHYFGTQGSMRIVEGSGSHHIFENGTQAIYVEKQGALPPEYYPLKRSFSGGFQSRVATTGDGLRLNLMSYSPHSKETIDTWIKNDHMSILGLDPIPVFTYLKSENETSKVPEIPSGGKIVFHPDSSIAWNLYAVRTNAIDDVINALYQEAANQKPLLAIIEENENRDVHFAMIDTTGKISRRHFSKGLPESFIAYEGGFKGYTITANDLPINSYPLGTEAIESATKLKLKEELTRAVKDKIELSPPLKLLQNGCDTAKVDFPSTCVDFLSSWNATHRWIYQGEEPLPPSLSLALQHIDWNLVPPEERQGCVWTAELFSEFDPELQKGTDALTLLKNKGWPLLPTDTTDPLTTVTRQVFAASEFEIFPFTPPITAEENARLLSAYLRAYGIHLTTISPTLSEAEINSLVDPKNNPITLETFLTATQHLEPPPKKLEDNRPTITVHARKNSSSQTITLGYESNATGLKWPILNGEYLVRFQPAFEEIPYHVRLRNARQINYPNSTQPFSFESDLIVTDRRTNGEVETTISMNHVYETWDGYRFYLSGMAPADETAIKQVQIVVNHDPTKYWLTYSGGCILTCGILLLFFFNKNRE